jgi:hypothetical protein
MMTTSAAKTHPDEFGAVIDFFAEKLRGVEIVEGVILDEFNNDIVANIKEVFFDLCNGLLIGRKDNSLPFGVHSGFRG